MEDLSKKIKEAMLLIDGFFDELKPVINGSLVREKEKELIALEKLFKQFKRSKKPMPKDFLDLKEKILHDLEQMEKIRKEYPGFIIFLQNKLREILLEDQPEGVDFTTTELLHQASYHPNFLRNLINKGVVNPNLVIERTYQNKKYKAKILLDGKIQFVQDGQDILFENIHSAASYIAETEVNGLDFWRVKNPINNCLVRLSVFLK